MTVLLTVHNCNKQQVICQVKPTAGVTVTILDECLPAITQIALESGSIFNVLASHVSPGKNGTVQMHARIPN